MAFALEINKNEKLKGVFTISLDFELHWGVSDYRTVESYRENLENTPKVVRRLLNLFTEKGIHVTWATVGFLFCENKDELLRVSPKMQPSYENINYLNYRLIPTIGDNEQDAPFHYAPSLIKKIKETPFQEISTHTYSHYLCLENGQNIESFAADLDAACVVAEGYNRLDSIIFPRNQYKQEHIETIEKAGIRAFRGNQMSWIYSAQSRDNETLIKRASRLMDSYVNLSGLHIYNLEDIKKSKPYNIPASQFLRPFSHRLKKLEGKRLHKIKSVMTAAAQQGKLYHLWWHPHNFGANTEENFAFLNEILSHFQTLAKEYGMVSRNMREIADYLDNE
jgi:hypothetical protein